MKTGKFVCYIAKLRSASLLPTSRGFLNVAGARTLAELELGRCWYGCTSGDENERERNKLGLSYAKLR